MRDARSESAPTAGTKASPGEPGGLAHYSFGDTDLAAERLAVLARVFEAPSRAFLRVAAPRRVERAIDLGCGPGATTRLVAEVTGARRTVGLDASEAFVARARTGAGPELLFEVHDVTRAPLPGAPADLAYARTLVSHLSEPRAALAVFAGALAPRGRLLLDEVEEIGTREAVFGDYLALVEATLEARGQRLFVGNRLEGLAAGIGRIAHSTVARHPVSARDAATMFSMNLVGLRHDPAVRARASERELGALADALAAIRDGERGADAPLWGLRQLAIEVDGSGG